MIDPLDLPVLKAHPTEDVLLTAIASLHKPAATFVEPAPVPLDAGSISWLTRVVASPLDWLTGPDTAESIRDAASAALASNAGRTAVGCITRTFALSNGASLTLREPGLQGDALGLKTWLTSFLLARELPEIFSRSRDVREDTRICELGAGTGLVGMAIARYFPNLATPILLTDYIDEILLNLRHNATHNQISCTVAHLDWEDPIGSVIEGKFDLLVASDCIYTHDQPTLLLSAIDALAHDHTAILVAYPLRRGNDDIVDQFNRQARAAGWQITDHGQMMGYEDFAEQQTQTTCIWQIRRRLHDIDSKEHLR
ncbi:hypothetical protein PYCC9005_004500 [Savitreella phatthalungensis]